VCDTIAVVRGTGVLFAKNSDRDPNESQILDWQPRRQHQAGTLVRCTWIAIPQVAETYAVLLSRPYWMWGAEMGANEHGVTIGNEAVFTRAPSAAEGLTGMDLLRLALERAESAHTAVQVIGELLERHGQGGGCGHENRRMSYHNSFLVADTEQAYVLETAGRKWAVEPVQGPRSISNGLTIADFARAHTEPLRTWVSRARLRQPRTQALATGAAGAGDLMRALRDHGNGHLHPEYDWLSGAMSAPCMHAGGLIAASQTTASWVAELRSGTIRHWVTATAAPCVSLFKPVRVEEPLDLGPLPTDRDDGVSLWWRHERLHRRILADPTRLAPLIQSERDEIEAQWLRQPPEPRDAFAQGDELLSRWEKRVASQPPHDRRPAWLRRYWSKRNARAAIRL
jgi:secernin